MSRLTGQLGESLAAAYYRREGYSILETNFRTRQGEIDIIAQKDGRLVFSEVKTRSGGSIARPAEWVDARKQQRLVRAAQAYIARHCLGDAAMRFDVIEVYLREGQKPLVHPIKNAFTL